MKMHCKEQFAFCERIATVPRSPNDYSFRVCGFPQFDSSFGRILVYICAGSFCHEEGLSKSYIIRCAASADKKLLDPDIGCLLVSAVCNHCPARASPHSNCAKISTPAPLETSPKPLLFLVI